MKIIASAPPKEEQPKTEEETKRLRDLHPGVAFRFPGSTYEGSVKSTVEDEGFYIVIKSLPPEETNRVSVISADFQLITKKDGDRIVIVHEATLYVDKAKQVPIKSK